MTRQLFFPMILFLFSCVNSENKSNDAIAEKSAQISQSERENKRENKINNALFFINSYVDNCNKMQQSSSVIDWANSSKLVTKEFKNKLTKLMDEAYEIDPELGLDADPIFDAQDYPENGFELDSFDSTSNYLIVKGKKWSEFRLTIKMEKENDHWLVDGCGMVNIPNDKKIEK